MVTQDNDAKVIHDARVLLDRAKREGSACVRLPVRLLEALIEKATRPHD